MTAYAYGIEDLTRMIDDVYSPIEDVIKEVERLCRREAQASTYYRAHPKLLFPGHPWLAFVAAGGAEYLGWDISESK